MPVALSEPRSVWALGAKLLEGPVWDVRDAALWFVDIKGRHVHRFDPASGAQGSWNAPGQVGFVLPVSGGGFVAGLQQGLHRFDPRDGSFTPLAVPESHLPGNRLNDATVDGEGRLWFGSMDDAEVTDSGTIYRLDEDGACQPHAPPCAITNGPAISPDGATLYHVDTLGGLLYACDITPAGGLANRRVLVTMDVAEGYPDGPTCDAEGCIWVGLYGGWGARRYSPSGALMETVRFPVSAVTKIAFGGPELRTAFATTASKHLSHEDLTREPEAGDLFAFEVEVPGVPVPLIRQGI